MSFKKYSKKGDKVFFIYLGIFLISLLLQYIISYFLFLVSFLFPLFLHFYQPIFLLTYAVFPFEIKGNLLIFESPSNFSLLLKLFNAVACFLGKTSLLFPSLLFSSFSHYFRSPSNQAVAHAKPICISDLLSEVCKPS